MMSRLNRCFPRLGYASLMSSALVLSAQAQEVLETLVVSGERVAPVLSSHVMLNRAADFPPGARLDPAELLQTLPGVQVDSRSNYAQDTRISLRGFGARHFARQFGAARLEVWEGDARKLQFTGTACVLDVFLSITDFMAGNPPRVWWHYTAERKRTLARRA